MEYWSDEEKAYVKSLTNKKIFFAGIRESMGIPLNGISDCFDIILAKSKTKNFYLAFKASDYADSKTTSVPKELEKLIKKAESDQCNSKNLKNIRCFARPQRNSKAVYIPANNSLLEAFFKETDKYFMMEEKI